MLNPMAYIKRLNVMLMWKKFEEFYKLIAFTRFRWEHAFANFPTLTHFLSSWVEFRKSKIVLILGPNFEPQIPWRLKPRRKNDRNHGP
jgi:hypothetical protein